GLATARRSRAPAMPPKRRPTGGAGGSVRVRSAGRGRRRRLGSGQKRRPRAAPAPRFGPEAPAEGGAGGSVRARSAGRGRRRRLGSRPRVLVGVAHGGVVAGRRGRQLVGRRTLR